MALSTVTDSNLLEESRDPADGLPDRIGEFLPEESTLSPRGAVEELSLDLNDRSIASPLTASTESRDVKSRRREVFRFNSDWLVSSVAWCNEMGDSLKLALCSYIEEYKNYVQLVSLIKDDNEQELQSLTVFDHPYPATKLLWHPRSEENSNSARLLATTADYLRIWRVEGNFDNQTIHKTSSSKSSSHDRSLDSSSNSNVEVKLACLLNSNQGSKLCAPLTSFDWNETDPSLIVTASVDTTCAVWNIETSSELFTVTSGSNSAISQRIDGTMKTQVVAHEHQVYDVSFSRLSSGKDIFVTSSGDGSIRLFDLRRLSTSKVLYEVGREDIGNTSEQRALVRVSCSKQDTNLVSAFAINSNEILIIDIRYPGRLVTKLTNHTMDVNGMSWAPHLPSHLCSASDDCQALIWDLSKLPSSIDEPVLAYQAGGKINSISWSTPQPDWIAITYKNCLELLKV